MNQNIYHTPKSTPPRTILPVLENTKSIYKLWQKISISFPKPFRFGLGSKIEKLFLEILEIEFLLKYSKQNEKINLLNQATHKIDILKFFLQITWENGYLKEKKFTEISLKTESVGREIYQWKIYLEKQNSRIL